MVSKQTFVHSFVFNFSNFTLDMKIMEFLLVLFWRLLGYIKFYTFTNVCAFVLTKGQPLPKAIFWVAVVNDP